MATESKYSDVSDVLHGTTVLITGAAGFVGTALLYRLLLDPDIRVKRVLALIRGKTVLEASAKLPEPLRKLARSIAAAEGPEDPEPPRLVILTGDCSRANLGLDGPGLKAASKADIVIHAAGDTRFLLGLPSAMEAITDLAYMAARFSLAHDVKTHVHLSTTYVGWFREHDSVVAEDLIQTDLQPGLVNHDTHVNTYLHAKTLAEGCVNALFTAQTGRRLHGKAARIVRISTLGAAASFPWPGCGANQTSTPVSAALAAVHIPEERLLSFMASEDAFVDVLPVDIAASQILALAAAAHQNHSYSSARSPPSHPSHPSSPVNAPGANVPVYNVASGLCASLQLRFLALNQRDVKIEGAYVKEDSLMAAYRPFIKKWVHFDTRRARAVLGLAAASGGGVGTGAGGEGGVEMLGREGGSNGVDGVGVDGGDESHRAGGYQEEDAANSEDRGRVLGHGDGASAVAFPVQEEEGEETAVQVFEEVKLLAKLQRRATEPLAVADTPSSSSSFSSVTHTTDAEVIPAMTAATTSTTPTAIVAPALARSPSSSSATSSSAASNASISMTLFSSSSDIRCATPNTDASSLISDEVDDVIHDSNVNDCCGRSAAVAAAPAASEESSASAIAVNGPPASAAATAKAPAGQGPKPATVTATAFNLSPDVQADLPIRCGALELDVASVLRRRFGPLTDGAGSEGWLGYLRAVRDEMMRGEAELAGEEAWVD